MEPLTHSIHSLIAKSLTDQLDDHEQQELENWKNASEENQKEYNDLVAIWIKSGDLKLPSALNTKNAFRNIQQQTFMRNTRKRWINLSLQAVAVLLLSVLFSGVYSYLANKHTNEIIASQTIYQEVKAAFGTQVKVQLADGTTVFLNSGSKLRFPQTFDNLELRSVALDGEGYFKVAKNQEKPFIVQAKNLDIKVLGTTFNVDAYHDNNVVLVALVEGSVQLQSNDKSNNETQVNLSPNQVATLSHSSHKISKADVKNLYKYTEWINGNIVLVNDPIETVVNKLGKWYNVEFVIADKRLNSYRFTGTFTDESLEQILDLLCAASLMDYKIESVPGHTDQESPKRIVRLKSKKLK